MERTSATVPGCTASESSTGCSEQLVKLRIVFQWFRFAAVGVTNTLLSTAIFAGLEELGLHYLVGSSLAFAVGALNSYTLNRRWTFHSHAPPAPELGRFLIVQAVGLGVNLAVLAALIEVVSIRHIFAQLLAFPAASVVTFALSRQWAFRPRTPFSAVETG
jgi:putative flippase GtrA